MKIILFLFLSFSCFVSFSSTNKVTTKKLSFTHPNGDGTHTKYNGYLVTNEGNHPLNQLVRKIELESAGLKVIVSDELLQNVSVRGAYDYQTNKIYIMSENLELEDIDLVVLHEFLHARMWIRLRNNIQPMLLLSGLAYNSDVKVAARPYGNFFGLDELAATMFSLVSHKVRLSQALVDFKSKLNDNPQASRSARRKVEEEGDHIRTYALRLTTMLRTLRFMENNVEMKKVASPKDLDFLNLGWLEFRFENIRVVMPGVTAEESRLAILNFSNGKIMNLENVDKIIFMWGSSKDAQFVAEADSVLGLLGEIELDFEKHFSNEMTLMKDM